MSDKTERDDSIAGVSTDRRDDEAQDNLQSINKADSKGRPVPPTDSTTTMDVKDDVTAQPSDETPDESQLNPK